MIISTDELTKALNSGIDPILRWALVLAAVATVVMALLEAVKAAARLRYAYHWAFVRTWLGVAPYQELKSLTVGRDKRPGPLLDQPTDKLMAQIQAASNLALDFPTSFPDLYRFLTAGIGADADTWRKFNADVDSGAITNPAADPLAAPATRARARLDHRVARKLDSFQTKTEYWWARVNQLVAVAGCAWVLILLMHQEYGGITATNLLIAVVGGTVAPVAKDVAVALSGLRGK